MRPRRRRVVPAICLAALPALVLHGVVLGSLPKASTTMVPGPAPVVSVRTVAARPPALPQSAVPVRSPLPEPPAVDAQPALPQPATPVGALRSKPPKQHAAEAVPRPSALPGSTAGEPERNSAPKPPDQSPSSGEDVMSDRLALAQPLPGSPPDVDTDPALQLAAVGAGQHGSGSAPPALAVSAPAASRDDDQVDASSVPLYRTVFPPSQTLRYDLRRGVLSGNGELRWQREGAAQPGSRYELQLEARIGSMVLLTQVSTGGFDQAGLAPVRFTDRRLRSSARAANFQRQRAIVSFSGPSIEYPLLRGTQDRLSWMMQLPAILAASPQLAAAGEKVTLYVIGARGDAALWDFRFVGRERVGTDAGPVDAVKFVREPRKPHDTSAEVWLDPARHFLPVRARIGNPDDGAMLELSRAG